MCLSNEFKRTEDQSELKMRVLCLNFIKGSLENFKFLFKTNVISFIIKESSWGMPEFDNENILFNTFMKNFKHHFFKEAYIFAKVIEEGKLVLERLP